MGLCWDNGISFPKKVSSKRELIGKTIEYVLRGSVDSYRGYFSSQIGEVQDVFRSNVLINNEWIYAPNILEYRLKESKV